MPFLQLWEHCDIQSDADQTLIYELLDQILCISSSNCLPLAFIRRNSEVYHGDDLLKETTRFFRGAISSRIDVKTALYWSTEATTSKSPIVRQRCSRSRSLIFLRQITRSFTICKEGGIKLNVRSLWSLIHAQW